MSANGNKKRLEREASAGGPERILVLQGGGGLGGLPGRRLRGTGRGRNGAELGGRNLDRGDQWRVDRRQPTRKSGRAAAGVLGNHNIGVGPDCPTDGAQRRSAQGVESGKCVDCRLVRVAGVFPAAFSAGAPAYARHAGRP